MAECRGRDPEVRRKKIETGIQNTEVTIQNWERGALITGFCILISGF
jgi:hypothetical protein